MSVPSGQVTRLTPSEVAQLTNWGFINSYKQHHAELVDLAMGVYIATCHVLSRSPTEDQFYQSYWKTLIYTDLYRKDIVGKKFSLPPSLYPHFAGLLAKYVLEKDWGTISNVPCP